MFCWTFAYFLKYLYTNVVTIAKSVSGNIFMTLTERTTITTPYYLFVATHRGTNEEIKFVLPVNTSLYTFRYDKFQYTTQFDNSDIGFWDYKVYEQVSDTNTDTALTGSLIEEGYMQLIQNPEYNPSQYSGANNQYKIYNG